VVNTVIANMAADSRSHGLVPTGTVGQNSPSAAMRLAPESPTTGQHSERAAPIGVYTFRVHRPYSITAPLAPAVKLQAAFSARPSQEVARS
jgi:hypothetical protein